MQSIKIDIQKSIDIALFNDIPENLLSMISGLVKDSLEDQISKATMDAINDLRLNIKKHLKPLGLGQLVRGKDDWIGIVSEPIAVNVASNTRIKVLFGAGDYDKHRFMNQNLSLLRPLDLPIGTRVVTFIPDYLAESISDWKTNAQIISKPEPRIVKYKQYWVNQVFYEIMFDNGDRKTIEATKLCIHGWEHLYQPFWGYHDYEFTEDSEFS